MSRVATVPTLILGLAGLLAANGAVPAFADSIALYDNTVPANTGSLDALVIMSPNAVSDSFTLAAPSIITGATFDAWLSDNQVPDQFTSIEWSIGTNPYDGSLGTGGAVPATTGQGQLEFYGLYVLEFESISIPDISLAAGTYWFTLQDGSTVSGNEAGWDVSNGPSTAFESGIGNVNGYYLPGTDSNTFQVLGTDTPEPSSLLLLGSGLAGLAVMIRRKLKT